MATFLTPANVKSASVHAVVTRADGTVEDLGVIAVYNRNPFIQAIQNFLLWIKRR